ncbi:MAG: hypothetical protein ABI322_04985 [Gemmatimonadaceae bacterium]
MHRSTAARIFTSLVAVWFAFVTIQPPYGDPCPHHQPALAALAQALGADGIAPHSMAAHRTHGSSGHHSGSHSCNCLGVCCGAAPVAIAQPAVEWVPPALAMQESVGNTAPVARIIQTFAPHFLPFATAPPPTLLA